jgi:hypothetical protein
MISLLGTLLRPLVVKIPSMFERILVKFGIGDIFG